MAATAKDVLSTLRNGRWWERLVSAEAEKKVDPITDVGNARRRGQSLLKDIVKATEFAADSTAGRGAGDSRWLAAVLSSGSTADRVAALSGLVQELPVCRIRSLDALLALAAKRVRREALLALDALADLFATTLLPPQALRRLEQRKLPLSGSPVALVLYHFEEEIRLRFVQFLVLLESAVRDPVASLRQRVLRTVQRLLLAAPEHEPGRLLALLTNKLGDPDARTASQTSRLLVTLLRHERLKPSVVAELQTLLARDGLDAHTRLQAVATLNQLLLRRTERQLAASLLHFYIRLFHAVATAESPSQHKPNTVADPLQMRRKRQRRRTRQRTAAVETTKPLPPASDPLQSKLIGALLTGINRVLPYVDLDKPEHAALLDEHLDSLFRVVHVSSFNKAVQALLLLYQLALRRPSVADRFYRALYAMLQNVRSMHEGGRAALFLNVCFKAMRADQSLPRTKALLKRLLQVALHVRPGFACGALLVAGELLKTKPGLLALLQLPEETDALEVHKDVAESSNSKVQGKASKEDAWAYDWRSREPSSCGAERVGLWEVTALAQHSHPSVAKMARALLSGAPLQYDSDPLTDLALAPFLDRFVQKKPKALKKDALAPRAAVRSKAAVDLLSPAFAALPVEKVPPDQLFFHQYMRDRAVRQPPSDQTKSKRIHDDDDDEDDINDGADSYDNDDDDADVPAKAKPRARVDDDHQDEDNADGLLDDEADVDEDEADVDVDVDDDDDDDDDDLEAPPEFDPHMFDDESGSDVYSDAETGPSDTFAAAEEFAELLEDGPDGKVPAIQAKWEAGSSEPRSRRRRVK